ncbi:hypothetical protein C922_03838 [Plasmodium inui San Antonio 1]|uniref:Condensin complex subunit 1 C-terminal domain-containing protein n=1 Tax=Plasmodium inui San Antonio 1 TaxID=1237626 RepID=W7A2E3_9APIC|nr:hypothetical protein C922_03838 [Plasmodium inui San Antonio 1]EUD65855.1 hypothetical protein C922_03838 [Plasmodium inui San Antonio 1]
MLQGKIKKFKLPINNNIDNFLKDISLKKNEYVYGCGAEDIENVNLKAECIINYFTFINESYGNLLLLLCQEGFDTVLNYIRISDNLNDGEQEKIFGCLTILIEKSVDVFKNYLKCVEKYQQKNGYCDNGVEMLQFILNENNSIMNMIIQCLEDNYKEYSVHEKRKKKFTFFEIHEILTSYFNALTFIYLNLFNCYYNHNFCKQQNSEMVVVNVQRGRKKLKKDNDEETNVALKNMNCLLNNIILLVSNINFDILYDQVNIPVVDLYLQFFLNIYTINQENNNMFNMSTYHDHISMIIGTLLKMYIKEEKGRGGVGALSSRGNTSRESHKGGGKKSGSSGWRHRGDFSEGLSEDSEDGVNDHNKGDCSADQGGTQVKETRKDPPKEEDNKSEKSVGEKFYSFSFTYIFLNNCKKCTTVNICDALLRVKNTDIPTIIIKEFIDYIKENSLLYLNLSVQTHAQNEILNVLNFLEYLSKNLSFHLLSFLKDLKDMLGIDIYYIRKSIFEIFKNFITLAKASEEVNEGGSTDKDGDYGHVTRSERFKMNMDTGELEDDDGEEEEDDLEEDDDIDGEDDVEGDDDGAGEAGGFDEEDESEETDQNDDSSEFFSQGDDDESQSSDEEFKKGNGSRKKKVNARRNNRGGSRKNAKKGCILRKKQQGQNRKRKKKKMNAYLRSFRQSLNESKINTYKDMIHKIVMEDIPFLQLCFSECLKNRAFVMNVLMSRQHDSKLHVRCHLLKVLQELIENNFIPLNYYNNLCLICSERINDKSPLVRQRAFSLLSCIASDVVKNKYVIPLHTNRIKKELANLSRRKEAMKRKELSSGTGRKRVNLSDSDSSDGGGSDITDQGEVNGKAQNGSNHNVSTGVSNQERTKKNHQNKYDLLIKMYNEVLFISIIVDDCVELCFRLLYSVVETDQKSAIRFIILAHMCGNKKVEEQMNKVWSLIFSNNSSIVEIIITEFVNVNITCDDYRISAFRLINVCLNSKLKDLSCLEKIMECLLMQEKCSVSVTKLLDELFNIIFVDTFSENKNLIIKEGALLLMKILCYSIHTVNLKKGKKEHHFVFSNKRKHLILVFINQYKENLHFINLLILILRYNKTNKIVQNLLIILFNLVFDHMSDGKGEKNGENFSASEMSPRASSLGKSKGRRASVNDVVVNTRSGEPPELIDYFPLHDDRNVWFKCCQSIVESMYEHFDDFLAIFAMKMKSMLSAILCGENKSANEDFTESRGGDSSACRLRSKGVDEAEESPVDKSSKVSCFMLTKFIFVSGHLGLYTYIYAEKIQNNLKKIASKSDSNYGMCTKEEKDREYFDYVVENMIVCNNLLGKKILPLIFLILNNPESFFNDCVVKGEADGGNKWPLKSGTYPPFKDSDNMKGNIYMHYEMYLLVLVCLLTLCKFCIISQKFCQSVMRDHVSIIQLIVSIITEEGNSIFELKTEMLLGKGGAPSNGDDARNDRMLRSDSDDNGGGGRGVPHFLQSFSRRGRRKKGEGKKEDNHLCIENEKVERFVTQEEDIQDDPWNLFRSRIMFRTVSNVRKMLLISYADLLYRHPNLLEPYNKYIFKVLNDKDINLRRTAVSVFTHLFMTDTVKAKNILLVHMMYLTIDKDEKISSGSKSFFYELDRKSHVTLVNNICDMISVLAKNEKKLKYEMNKEIEEFLLSFIKKSKYNETLVEKIFKKMKEVNINNTDALKLYMQVFLNIQIDEKVLSRMNKNFPLIRYIIRENQYIQDSFIHICKKATEKKRGRPAEEGQHQQQQQQQQSNASNNEKGNNERVENDKLENKMRELAEDILGKIESTTNKSKNVSNAHENATNVVLKESRCKDDDDVVRNDEELSMSRNEDGGT